MDHVVIIKGQDHYYLMLQGKTGMIHGFHSETDGVRYFEDGYNTGHARSYESSMSAAIHWMTFQPSIVSFPTIEALASTLKLNADSDILSLSSVAGFMTVVDIDQEAGSITWENGVKPRLTR